MINFNFEHFFEEELRLQEEDKGQKNAQINYQEKPSLAFLDKQALPQKPVVCTNELTLSEEIKRLFQPTIEQKKQIIEDFLKWTYDNDVSADFSGCHLKYIDYLRSRG